MNDAETIAIAAGGKTTQVGAGTTLAGWMLSSEAGVLIGIVIGLAGFAIQIYFNIRRDRREKAEHEARMRQLGGSA